MALTSLTAIPRYSLIVFLLCCHVSVYASHSFTAPIGGDSITAGQPYEIEWVASESGPVFIQLSYNDNQVAGNITNSTNDARSYTWTPDNALAGFNRGSNYFLVLCNVDGSECAYTPNGRFSIVAESGPSTIVPVGTSTSSLSSSSSTITSVTGSSTASSSSSTSTTPSSSPAPAAGGLPVEGKIAIGAIIPVVFICALATLIFLIWRRKRRSQQHQRLPYDAQQHEFVKPELPASSSWTGHTELSGHGQRQVFLPPQELDTRN